MRDELEKLSNRIWKTWKIRINAAERLKSNNAFFSFISIYYSAVLSGISIINFSNKSDIMDMFSIVLSIMVTILFLFFEGKAFRDRHENMKKNYNDIYSLYYKIQGKLQSEDAELTCEDLEKYSDEYIELLNRVENHLDIDFLTYLKFNENEKFRNWEWVKYHIYQILIKFLFRITIFLIPTTLLIVSILQLFGIIPL